MIRIAGPAIGALVVGAVVLLWPLMGVRLPRPSGAYAVGSARSHLAFDADRPDRISALSVWYPATSGGRAAYRADGHGLEAMLVGWLVRSSAAPGAPVASQARRFPALISIASWGGVGSENTALCEDLASHGFVVIALDDMDRDRHADPAVSGPLDLSSDRAVASTMRLASRKRTREAQRVSRLIDRVTRGEASFPADVARSIDAQRIAVIGYSFGGAVAFAAAQVDPRIRAAINLDGWMFAGDSPPSGREFPYLFVGTVDVPPSAADVRVMDHAARAAAHLDADDRRFMDAEALRGGVAVTIPGADHGSFRDDLRLALVHRSNHAIPSARVMRVVTNAVLPFVRRSFDRHARSS
jgi:dienelactone hydrolase